jgi:hypothetical protein
MYAYDDCLFRFNGFDRAIRRAGAAFNAGTGVDLVFSIALGNRANRAGLLAVTARDAIVMNYICHGEHLQKNL